MAKPKLALYWAASCGGCEIAVLDIEEKILDVAANFDIVFWPCATDFKYKDVEEMADKSIDLCLFNGAIPFPPDRRPCGAPFPCPSTPGSLRSPPPGSSGRR